MRRFQHSILTTLIVTLVCVGSCLWAGNVWAGRSSWEAGLRAGQSFNGGDEDFNQYDVYVNFGLPWSWQWGRSVLVDTNLAATVGVLDGGGDTGVAGSVGFEFVFGRAEQDCPFELRAGSALTLISDHKYGDEDLGGPVQFTHHISLYYWLLENMSVLARIQHMSNAGIYSKNPGLEMVMLGLLYRF